MKATDKLTAALISLASEGGRPPCGLFGGSELWVSEDKAERAAAAAWCQPCPVRQQCHDAAEENNETFGVWAGIDRTVTTKPKTSKQRRRPAA